MILSLLGVLVGCGQADPAPAPSAAPPAPAPAQDVRVKAGKGKHRGEAASPEQVCASYCARFGECTGVADAANCTAGCLAELPHAPRRYGCTTEPSCLDFGLCLNRCATSADCPGGAECGEVAHNLCDGAGGPNTECSADVDCKPGQTCRHITGKSCMGGDY